MPHIGDAVFTEGGRLHGEVQASERESISAGSALGLYAPRIKQQVEEVGEGGALPHTKAAMCRTARLKYVRRAYETDELYDLADDPGETRNLIAAPGYREAVMEMRERLLTWYMETGDVVPPVADQRGFARAS